MWKYESDIPCVGISIGNILIGKSNGKDYTYTENSNKHYCTYRNQIIVTRNIISSHDLIYTCEPYLFNKFPCDTCRYHKGAS